MSSSSLGQRPAVEAVAAKCPRHSPVGSKSYRFASRYRSVLRILLVFVAEFRDRRGAGGDVALVIHAARPEPQQIGAVAIDFLRGGDIFLVALADLGAIGLDDKSMGQHLLEWRACPSPPGSAAAKAGTSRDAGPTLPDTNRPGSAATVATAAPRARNCRFQTRHRRCPFPCGGRPWGISARDRNRRAIPPVNR